jgi:aryl-alcohol dehydrogenase-like predicted oxidoreductase
VDDGGNFIDKADLYTNGMSETWLGKFVTGRNSQKSVQISSTDTITHFFNGT